VFPFDADDPVRCTGKFSGGGRPLISFDGDTVFDPSASQNPDELWLTITEDDKDIYSFTRVDGEFDDAVPASFNTSADELDPAITGDGEALLFLRDGRVHEVTRRDGAFGQEVIRTEIEGSISGLDVSIDGLRVYVSSDPGIHVVERASRTSAFGPAQMLGIETGSFPSISPDELEIYYNVGSVIRRRTRASLEEPFGPEESVLEGPDAVELEGADPEVDATGSQLLYVVADEVFVHERACE
jgi:hypothetical protein